MKAWLGWLDRWEDEHPSLSACLGALMVAGCGVVWALLLFMLGD
jgi:hypothetical protein